MQLAVCLKNPTSLEQAMSFVTEEETLKNYTNNQNTPHNSYSQPPKIFSTPPIVQKTAFP